MALIMTVGGVEVDSTAAGLAPVLAELEIKWGVEREGEQPGPSTMSFTVCVVSAITDAPWLVDGAPVQLRDETDGITRYIFTGRIRRQQAATDGLGRLHILVTCADYLTEFSSTFVSCDLSPVTAGARYDQITTLMSANGFASSYDASLVPPGTEYRAQTTSQSVKLQTLLERFANPLHRTFYDATTAALPTTRGSLRFLPVRPATMSNRGILYTLPDGRWYVAVKNAPGDYSYLIHTHADNVLRGVEWTLDTDNVTTAVGISAPDKDDPVKPFTEMTDGPEYTAGTVEVDKFGMRRVAVETDLRLKEQTTNPTLWADTVARLKAAWLDTNPEWQPAGVTIRDPTELNDGAATWTAVLDLVQRSALWFEVYGVQPNQPKYGFASINAAVIGGTLRHTVKGWQITLALSKTIMPLPATAGLEWTIAAVDASTNPAIKDATFGSIGDTVTPSDFLYINKGS